MPLDRQQVKALVTSVAETRENEIGCDECLAGMAEFAETQLVGTEIPAALQRIEAHLSICSECTEEYELLLDVVRSSSSAGQSLP